MKSLIAILLGLYGSWDAIDLHSKSVLHNAIAPFVFILFLIAFTVWLALRLGPSNGSADSGAGWDGGDFSDGGGDGGGGD
jgi:hypothetical protein